MTLSRRGLSIVAGLGAAALAVSACGGGGSGSSSSTGGTGKTGGTLKVIGAGGQDDLDPTSAYSTSAAAIIRTYGRQLFSYPASTDETKSTTPTPDAAADTPTADNGGMSKDGKTYKITLRSGIMWDSSPPREMVAGDFVRSFKRMCNPAAPVGAPSYYLPVIQGMQAFCEPYLKNTKLADDLAGMQNYEDTHDIAGVKALDDHTIQFKLNAAASDFLNLIAMPFASAVPVEYYKYKPDTPTQFTHLISAGPYKVTTYSPGKSIVLDKNPNWKADTDPLRHQYVDRVQITEGQNNYEAIQQQLEAGTQDLSYDVAMSSAVLGRLASKNDPNLTVNGPPISNPYLVFNLRSPNNNKAMANVKVRQAINYAINKVALAKVYGGPKYNTPLNGAVPPDAIGYKDFNLYPTTNNEGDAAKCKQLLSEAGYGSGLTLKAAYRQSGNHPQIYQSYSQDLQACGIKITGVPQQAADFYTQFLQKTANATAGKWDIAAPGWVPDWFGNNGRAALQPLFDGTTWVDGTSNYGDYNSATTNALMDKAIAATSTGEAAQLWQEANQQIMKDAAIVPFMSQKTPWYHSSRVKNAIWIPINQQFDYTSIQLG